MFTQKISRYVCDGDTITCEVDGFIATATIYQDNDNSPPWERDVSRGPVSDGTTRAKRPGERILASDRQSRRYYDFQAAIAIARAEGWDTEPYNTGTKGERAARAAEQDFEVLRAWCNDEWHYFGVAVTIARKGRSLTGQYAHALWGIEGNYPGGDNSYFLEVANDLLPEALKAAKQELRALVADAADLLSD